jgi:hypothetical protein
VLQDGELYGLVRRIMEEIEQRLDVWLAMSREDPSIKKQAADSSAACRN